MPSIITHSCVGIFGALLVKARISKSRFWFFSILCPIFPDFDVISFAFGIAYGDFWGHRGFTHSILFALILSILVVVIFFKNKEVSFVYKFGLIIYFFIITASHGLLDALTSGGFGVALFSPFDNTRYFYSFTPIVVSPIGILAFFSEWGARVIKSEVLWVWLPLFTTFSLIKIAQKIVKIYKS